MASSNEITMLLDRGDSESLARLFPLVYDELRKIAGALFQREFRPDHTLQPTALVHEAFLRLVGDRQAVSWQSRAHFFGIAARSMRQILVNHAVAHSAGKRGAGYTIISLDEAINFLNTQNIEILTLHEALDRLEEFNERLAKIVELRFFGGLTLEETAVLLDSSTAAVYREWELAKAWLYRQLKATGGKC